MATLMLKALGEELPRGAGGERRDVALKSWVRNREQKLLWECCRSTTSLAGKSQGRHGSSWVLPSMGKLWSPRKFLARRELSHFQPALL